MENIVELSGVDCKEDKKSLRAIATIKGFLS